MMCRWESQLTSNIMHYPPRSGSVQSVSTAGISEMTSASGQSGASNTGGDNDNDNNDDDDALTR